MQIDQNNPFTEIDEQINKVVGYCIPGFFIMSIVLLIAKYLLKEFHLDRSGIYIDFLSDEPNQKYDEDEKRMFYIRRTENFLDNKIEGTIHKDQLGDLKQLKDNHVNKFLDSLVKVFFHKDDKSLADS